MPNEIDSDLSKSMPEKIAKCKRQENGEPGDRNVGSTRIPQIFLNAKCLFFNHSIDLE
jgi:hypothetical protein